MKIIPPSAFITMPWKNGGGTTHEILKAEYDGALLWRLSIAEVASDGPFSLFPGLSRILTVIDGEGLALTTPERSLQALPLTPLPFSGDWPIESRRLQGDVRDFNVIFNATHVAVDVVVYVGGVDMIIAPSSGVTHAFLALGGGVANGEAIPFGAAVIANTETVKLTAKGPVLVATLQQRGLLRAHIKFASSESAAR